MAAALALGRRGLGMVWPNPAVGCVIVSPSETGGRIIGRGWTQRGGRPHAETEALTRAGASSVGASAYITLEPCSHQGKTPPCADALIAGGVKRVVAAIEDPDPRVAGRGFEKLRAAGLDVATGVCAEEAEEINAGFLMRHRKGRPLVTLKTATTLDGRIATHRGESQWITGEAARRRAHLLRLSHDAVMIGIGTALVDDPELTCRLPGATDRSPVRIVVDARLQLPLVSKLVRTAREVPTWIVTSEEADDERREAFEELGVRVLPVEVGRDHYPEPETALKRLAEEGLTRVLVEGGSALSAALMRSRLVDRVAWFRSGAVIGDDGIPVVASYGVDRLADMRRFRLVAQEVVGEDTLETYRSAD